MTEQDIRNALPHLANVEPIGNPPFMYRITMEEGYWIHKPSFEENMWKQSTSIYPDEDLTAIQIVAEADLPEGAEQCGGVTTEPELEVQ